VIRRLAIRNYALIKGATLDLEGGFTVLTGETGTGKTLILEAVEFAFGARANPTVVGPWGDSCEVEVAFDGAPGFEAAGIAPARQNSVRRMYFRSGGSRITMNGTAVTAAQLAPFAAAHLDFSGQFESQALLSPSRHLAILDSFGDARHVQALREYAVAYGDYVTLRRQLADASRSSESRALEIAELTETVRELQALDLKPGERDELEGRTKMLENAAQILAMCGRLQEGLYSAEGSAYDRAETLRKTVGELAQMLPEFTRAHEVVASLNERMGEFTDFLKDGADALAKVADGISLDPAELEGVRSRLDAAYRLERKHRTKGDGLVTLLQQASKRLAELESVGTTLEEIEAKAALARERLLKAGRAVSAGRKKIRGDVSAKVNAALGSLGFSHAEFFAQTTPIDAEGEAEPGADGLEKVEFFVSLNPGQPAKPLSLVASGGEVSRLMLALKSVLNAKMGFATVCFDEIEVGIGGGMAAMVADLLSEMAVTTLVVAVTHNPIIASRASCHFAVEKAAAGDTVAISVRRIDERERVSEIERMLGRVDEEATGALARKMVKQSGKQRGAAK